MTAAALLLALAASLAAGASWQRLALAREARRPLARGRFVDAPGVRLRVAASGEARPGPVVVLDCGIAGPTSASWAWVQRGVAAFAPVVSYDRAGLGLSGPGALPRDGRTLARELRAALAAAGQAPPFVLVGHSFGGLLARLFADEFPGDVAGVVLVDSSHPRQARRAGLRLWHELMHAALRLAPWAAHAGLMRALAALAPLPTRRLPEPERSEQLGHYARPSHWRGACREFDAWRPLTNAQVESCGRLGDRPLVVLTAGLSARHYPGWAERQAELAGLSSDAVHRVAAGADHALLVLDEVQSQAVVEAVRDVVAAVRGRRPLARS